MASAPTPRSTPTHENSPSPTALMEEEIGIVFEEIRVFGWNDQEIGLLKERANEREEFYYHLLLQTMDKNQVKVFERYFSRTCRNQHLLGRNLLDRLLAHPENWAHQEMLFLLLPMDNRLGHLLTNRLQVGDYSFVDKFRLAYPQLWSSMLVGFSKHPLKTSHKA